MRKLVILLLVLAGIALVCSDSAYASAGPQSGPSQCDPPVYYGIQHCVEADGAAQVIVVDLNDPHIRFKTVLPKNVVGQECNSVNPSSLDPASNCPYPYPFEKLTDMLARYKATGAVAIINTDYFGCAGNSEYPCGSPAGFHGAQGLAVRDGERLDGPQHAVDNSLATEQTSLMIFPSRIARIGFPESAAAIEAHTSSLFFNTVAGAPLIVQQGQAVNDRCTRPYPGDTCATQSQSAGGLTNDGRLVLITARMNSAGIARQLVIQHGVHTAIKFDGGGSARMAWVDANGVIETFSGTDENRPVAEGLLIFSEPISADKSAATRTPMPPPQKSMIDGFGMGSAVHLRVGSAQVDPALDELQAWHVGWTREEIPWGEVEPAPDKFRWQYSFGDTPRDFPALFTGLKSRGIHPVVILDYGPAYLEGPVPDEQLVARWRNYVQNVVTKFGSEVDYWEIGNEMNSRQFWGKVVYPNEGLHLTTPNSDLYARMLRAAYEVIKGHDPRDTVILGGLVGLTDGDCETSPFEYLRRLHAAGAWDAFDVIAIHPYWGANPPEAFIERGRAHDPDTGTCLADQTVSYNLVGEVRAIGDLAARFGRKPVWVTEVGWDRAATDAWAGYRKTEPAIVEADWLARTYVPLMAEPGVEKVFWYTQRDDPNVPGFELRAAGQQTLANLAELLTGSQPLGQFHGQKDRGGAQDDDAYEYRFDKGGQLIIVAWKARGGDTPRQVVIDELDVPSLRLYPADAANLSSESGKELVVTDGKVSIPLTEHPALLVSQKLSWWESLRRSLIRRVGDWWGKERAKLTEWWAQRQSDIAEQLEQWWQEQRARVQSQIDQWLRDLERRAAESLQREIEAYLNRLCGASMVPAGFAMAVWVGFSRRRKKP